MAVIINQFSVKLVKEKSSRYDLETKKINSPERAAEIIETVLDLQHEAQEKFGIITLNTKNIVAGIHIISVGNLDSSIVHPREVFKSAILNNAAAIICFHNHPSGDPTPSQDDIRVTARIADAGKLLGITVLDHIIVGFSGWVSMKERGLF